jgi:hypothetical protein
MWRSVKPRWALTRPGHTSKMEDAIWKVFENMEKLGSKKHINGFRIGCVNWMQER